MFEPAIPILDLRAVAAKGYKEALKMVTDAREFNPDSRGGVVIEDGEIVRVVIALDEDQAKRDGLA